MTNRPRFPDQEQRQIAVVTTSRADYSHLYWPLRRIQAHPELALRLIVLGAHLAPEFGCSAEQIQADGFDIDESIECLLSSDTDVGMAKTIGLASLGLADVLARMRPDILLLTADRYEMLAPASVALALRIPIAHIEGGEISSGAIDDAVRNALTKLSHIHFTPTEQAYQRVIAMDEEAWRVHCVGAPSLDRLRHSPGLLLAELEADLGINLACKGEEYRVVVCFHPVTLSRDTNEELDAFLAALARLPGPLICCYPNADAGSRELIRRLGNFCDSHRRAHLFTNLATDRYWGLLSHADLFIGNSSSGIMETPSLALPSINVGLRQHGRQRARNIIDVDAGTAGIMAAIEKARDPKWRASLAGMSNPYGDGHASGRIADILATAPQAGTLLFKQAASAIIMLKEH